MRSSASIKTALGLAFAALCPSPASADSLSDYERQRSDARKWELSYLALGAIDTTQTLSCLHEDNCTEGNPLLGKNPSAKKLLLFRLGGSLIHFAVFEYMNDRDPKAASRFAKISAGIQGGVVLINARLLFR